MIADLLRLYDSKLLEGGETFTRIIKSDLTDVTQEQSKIALIFPQNQKLTHGYFSS